MPISERFGGGRSMKAKAAFALGLLVLTAACGTPFVAPPRLDDRLLRERVIFK